MTTPIAQCWDGDTAAPLLIPRSSRVRLNGTRAGERSDLERHVVHIIPC